ncbi:cation diffusion facilitator family transporter [Leptospira sp. 96542]|nr:cation diffusion facilitator family transporter [Leptospira sp. 96542]
MNKPMNKPKTKRSKLIIYLSVSGFLSFVIFLIEWVGSKESGSLALFADAGHIITDVFAHLISLFAVLLASKKITVKYPFGFHRFEVLAALTNGLLLIFISFFIFYESITRFFGHSEIHVESMFVYSIIGLCINLFSALLLYGVSKESLNLKSAYLHVLSDLFGTLAVVLGAIFIHYTGYHQIDSFLSLALACFILKTSFSIVKESVQILLEADTAELDKNHLISHIKDIPGFVSVDLIVVRKLTSGVFSVELRIFVQPNADRDNLILEVHKVLKEEFAVPFVMVEVLSETMKDKIHSVSVREREHEFGHHHHHDHIHHHH